MRSSAAPSSRAVSLSTASLLIATFPRQTSLIPAFSTASSTIVKARSAVTSAGQSLKDASFKHCDLTMNNFGYAEALGIEIAECRAQGADFRGASFMNMITAKTWFCSAYITKSNLSYANFSKVVLEKCELWENRWVGTNVLGASFSGSDLSGGEFSSFDWRSANFTHCDLTQSVISELDIRTTDLEGVKLNSTQLAILAERLGIMLVD